MGGLHNTGTGTATIDHSIIADQAGGNDCSMSGTINDNGYNIDKDGTCSTFTQESSFSLPGLADNGGPTQTHALIPGGDGDEAIDAGGTSCGVTTDQRGELRPVDNLLVLPNGAGYCDIGAFEVQWP